MKFAYSVNFFVVNVCQRHIVAVHKRKTEIVVLEIKSVAHGRRHLVYETENAFIFAAALFVHQKIRKRKTEISIAFSGKAMLFPVAADNNGNITRNIRRFEHIIQHVADFSSVHADKFIVGFDFSVKRTFSVNGNYFCHKLSP